MKRNKRKNKKKRKSTNSGSSSDKRQRLSGYASDSFDSTISEALPETFGGETKESDSDRRGREKKEREQKKIEDKAERKRQGYAKSAANKTKPCIANIGGKRVEKNGIIEFEGGTDFWSISSRPIAEEATGISKSAIDNNISKESQSRGKKGIFENKQVMFINAPVDTSDRVPCVTVISHFSTKRAMIRHVREKHPEVLPPAANTTECQKNIKRLRLQLLQSSTAFLVKRVRSNIRHDIKKCDQKQLMAMVEGVDELPEPWPSTNIKGAADKYHLTEQQILDSIDNNEELTIEEGIHKLQLGLEEQRTLNLQDARLHLVGNTRCPKKTR